MAKNEPESVVEFETFTAVANEPKFRMKLSKPAKIDKVCHIGISRRIKPMAVNIKRL